MVDTPDRLSSAAQAGISPRLSAWSIALSFVIVMLLGLAVVLAVLVVAVRGELQSAQQLVPTLQQQIRQIDLAGARQTVAEAASHADRAAAASDNPVWWLGERLPLVGDDLAAVRQLSSVMSLLASDFAEPLLRTAADLHDGELLPSDSAIDMARVERTVNAIQTADAALDEAVAQTADIETADTMVEIADARSALQQAMLSARPLVDTVSEVAPALPGVLGADGPRRYALMFQNNAETRSLGGTALAFVVIGVDHGQIDVGETVHTSSAGFGRGAPVIDEPDDIDRLYGGDAGDYVANATVRPSFRSAAETVLANWLRYRGETLDGVVSVDPVAIGYLLRATGSLQLHSGDVLDPDSTVPLLLNGVYQRFSSGDAHADDARQNEIYSQAVIAVATRLVSGDINLPALIESIDQGWKERRILFFSAHEDEQRRLATAGLNGELPISDSTTDRIGVYFAETIGTKLAFYSSQRVTLAHGLCRDDGRQNYRVSVELGNGLDPAEVENTSDSVLGYYRLFELPKGLQKMYVYLYAPPGSSIVGATVDGVGVALEPFTDADYPVGRTLVVLPAGTSGTVVYDVVAGTPGQRALEAQVTPMVAPTPIETVPLDCATVPASAG